MPCDFAQQPNCVGIRTTEEVDNNVFLVKILSYLIIICLLEFPQYTVFYPEWGSQINTSLGQKWL